MQLLCVTRCCWLHWQVGGTEEYRIVEAIESKRITKPVVAWCIGTCARMFTSEVRAVIMVNIMWHVVWIEFVIVYCLLLTVIIIILLFTFHDSAVINILIYVFIT